MLYAGVTLYSDGVSRWTTGSLPASGAANALLYVAQQLTAGQQDQARSSVNGAVPGFPTATTSLALLDYDRDQYATGTTTLTMPSASPGWRSGVIASANTLTGAVTLSVPSGHSLDGVSNGSTILQPLQRARLIAASAAAPTRLRETGFVGTGERLADTEQPRLDHGIGSGEDELHAFLEVETSGGGFDAKANHLDDELRDLRWAAFAMGYNGPGYRKNAYDTKLAARYAFWRKIADTPWSPPAPAVAAVLASPITDEKQATLLPTKAPSVRSKPTPPKAKKAKPKPRAAPKPRKRA